MHFEHAQWPAGYKIVDVRDPAEMDGRSRMSDRLPGSNANHCYTLRDPALRHIGKGTLLTRLAMRRAGDLQFTHAADRFGAAIHLVGDGMPAYCFGHIHAGRVAISSPQVTGGDHWAEAGPGSGTIHSGHADTRLLTADGTVRTNIWVARSRFESALAACLHEPLGAPLVFAPVIDWTLGRGARLYRLFAHAEAEFSEPDGLATNPAALTAFVDLFIHTALRTLPHSYTERLARPDHPAPAHLRRAEAYLQAHADAALRLEDVAAAAGCSVRALQRAFRHFRDTTPHIAIQAVRLDHARAELTHGAAPVAAIARRFGFTKTDRFAVAYARRFGAPPSGDCSRRLQQT